MLSNFGHLQFTIFILNIIVLATLTRWNITFIFIGLGTCIAISIYNYFIKDDLNIVIGDTQFIIYTLLLIATAVIIFFKPKQEHQFLTEEKNEHLNGRVGSQEKQIREALALRSEFIRNVQHGYHAPMTGITSLTQTLAERYDRLTDKQRRVAIDEILKSSVSLDIFDSNLSALSALSKADYVLNLERIDLSNLLHTRIAICRKLYEENKEAREFDISIEKDIVIQGDVKYLTQVLDNLIVNAITYCKTGKITIDLEQYAGHIYLTVIDEGIGIPTDELENIFEEFTVSSKTRSFAGNRGVGLTLCKRVIEASGGSIKAESDGESGATFKVILPIS